MSRKRQYHIVANTGALLYALMELIYRGYTHFSMVILGGFCALIIYMINARYRKSSLLRRAVICGFVITLSEFVCGCLVNLCFQWEVWDYHQLPCNLLGQICPQFSFLWTVISIPAVILSSFFYDYANRINADDPKPLPTDR